jgi:hypothetical protein
VPERIRAKRVPHPDGGFEVVIYLEAPDGVQVACYLPMVNAMTLSTDLRLAILGEAAHRKEQDIGPGHQDDRSGAA